MEENRNDIFIQIKRVKQTSFFVNEIPPEQMEPQSTVKLDYKSAALIDKDLFEFCLKVTYILPNSQINLMGNEVQNVLAIKDLKKYADEKGDIKLPSNALIIMLRLAIGHSRALLAASVGGTNYSETILPIFNTLTIAKQFWGDTIEITSHLSAS